jgi:hypothetical protein
MQSDRTSEWFVPKFGSKNFRISVGIMFLPYTSIVTCFAALGSLSGPFEIERLIAISVMYFLAIGVAAHFLDAVGGKTKPWGDLPKRKLMTIAMIDLELFGGKFHNNISTVISWGILPVFAGSAIQTNSISIETIMISGLTALITYVLIVNSRKYKLLKRSDGNESNIKKKETILKLITLGVILGTVFFFIWRYSNQI